MFVVVELRLKDGKKVYRELSSKLEYPSARREMIRIAEARVELEGVRILRETDRSITLSNATLMLGER